jgi:hypothetical protein
MWLRGDDSRLVYLLAHVWLKLQSLMPVPVHTGANCAALATAEKNNAIFPQHCQIHIRGNQRGTGVLKI